MNDAMRGIEARHPIGVAAERTGLTPDVLRVWERRYAAVLPVRDAGGQRLYSDADLHRLRLLRRASEAGRAIGQVARLSPEELERLVEEDAAFRAPGSGAGDAGEEGEIDLERAEACCQAMDAEGLQALLARSQAVLGIPRFLEAVVAPLLRRIGEAWHERRLSMAQEHLATATIERVIVRGLDSIQHPPGAPVLLVATPAGERHEIGALLAAAVAAGEGWRVVYLGPDLPAEEIVGAARRVGARAVGISVVFVPDAEAAAGELRLLRSRLPRGVPLLVGGGGAAAIAGALRGEGIRVVEALPDLRAALRSGRID